MALTLYGGVPVFAEKFQIGRSIMLLCGRKNHKDVVIFDLSNAKILYGMGNYMEKRTTKRLVLSLSSIVAIGYGIYKGFINKEPPKYSLDWIKKLTDSQWETEREIIRQKLCSPQYEASAKIKFQNILALFDKVKSERDWAGRKPQGPAFHREHGWYL